MKCSGPGFNPQHHPNEPEHTDNSTHKQNWTVGKTHPEASIEGYVITPLWFWIWTRFEHPREHQSVSISNLSWHPPISCPRWTKLKPSFTGMSLLHPAAIQQWLSMFIMNSGHDTQISNKSVTVEYLVNLSPLPHWNVSDNFKATEHSSLYTSFNTSASGLMQPCSAWKYTCCRECLELNCDRIGEQLARFQLSWDKMVRPRVEKETRLVQHSASTESHKPEKRSHG